MRPHISIINIHVRVYKQNIMNAAVKTSLALTAKNNKNCKMMNFICLHMPDYIDICQLTKQVFAYTE